MKDYLEQLAACVHDTKLNRLPASTVTASKLVLLDTIGAMVAGSALPENVRLARMAAKRSPHGLCTLAGHGLKSDSLLATFTNATAGVALEMDEGNRLGGGHPAIHVIPGALAIVWAAAIRPYTSSPARSPWPRKWARTAAASSRR